MSQSNEKFNVFISYSHVDAQYLERLKVHLMGRFESDIEQWIWDDTQIQVGDRWRLQIDQALATADAAILLMSADFLASRFIVNNELPPLLKAADEKGIAIIPVILRPCNFTKHSTLSQFQAAYDPNKPLSSITNRHKQEEWWVAVANNIYKAINAKKKGLNHN